jgi:hypothetical protein
MRFAGGLGVVIVGAVLLLARAEGADDKRAIQADDGVKALNQKIAALEARLKALEAIVQLSGPNVKLVSGAGLIIQAGTDMAIRGGAGVSIQGASGVDLRAGAGVNIQGASGVDIRGAFVRLNNGSRPLARLGDSVVAGDRPGPGQITTGSPTVFGP